MQQTTTNPSSASAGEIARQLHEDEERLHTIQDSVKKSAQLREQIVTVLESFENRLKTLEATVVPLHEKTGRLQRKQQNIAKLLRTIDATLQFHSTSAEMETVIREGPAHNLTNYLKHMSQMHEAIKFFDNQPAYRHQLENMRMTLEFGCKALEKEYVSTVQSESTVVDAAAITDCLDQHLEVDMARLRRAPGASSLRDAARIRQLSDWLLAYNTGDRAFLDAYAAIRGENMSRTLAVICERRQLTKRTASLPATPNNVSGGGGGAVSNSPALLSVTPKSWRQALRKATGRSSDRYATRRLNNGDVEEIDVDTVLILFATFLALNELETELLPRTVGGVSEAARVQRALISRPLSYVVQRAQAALEALDGSTSVIVCLPLLRHLHAHESQLCALASNATVEIPIAALITTLNEACCKWLDDFVEQLSNDDSRFLPADGNVHQVTANTLSFLHSLLQHRTTVTHLLATQSHSATTILLPRLFARILSALGLNLKNKCENYQDEALAAIFMLNNQNHILTNLVHEGLLAIVCQQNSEVSAFYENEVLQYTEKYLKSWDPVLAACTDFASQGKAAIKAAFTAFIKEFETIMSNQRAYCISDVDLAGTIRNRVKSKIAQPYARFYNNFSRNLFSRNLDKYLKYDPDQVQLIIDRLFDASA